MMNEWMKIIDVDVNELFYWRPGFFIYLLRYSLHHRFRNPVFSWHLWNYEPISFWRNSHLTHSGGPSFRRSNFNTVHCHRHIPNRRAIAFQIHGYLWPSLFLMNPFRLWKTRSLHALQEAKGAPRSCLFNPIHPILFIQPIGSASLFLK
jgi:hypothetical protein